MRLWTLLAPLGSLPAGADVGATSRAWYEELRLAPVVADGLRDRGLDEAGAWWAAERIRMLLALAIPSQLGGRAATLPSRLVDAWFADPSVRAYLRVNRWDGADWFHRESWTELLAWSDRLERVLTPSDARVRKPVERSVLSRRLAEAAEASGYQVEGLRAALADPASHQPPSHRPSPAPEGHGPPAGPKAPPRRRSCRSAVPEAPSPLERDTFTATSATRSGTVHQTADARLRLVEHRPFRHDVSDASRGMRCSERQTFQESGAQRDSGPSRHAARPAGQATSRRRPSGNTRSSRPDPGRGLGEHVRLARADPRVSARWR